MSQMVIPGIHQEDRDPTSARSRAWVVDAESTTTVVKTLKWGVGLLCTMLAAVAGSSFYIGITVNGISAKFAAIDRSFLEVDHNFTNMGDLLDARFTAMGATADQRFTMIEQKITDGRSERLAQNAIFNQTFTNLDNRVDGVEANQAAVREQINALKESNARGFMTITDAITALREQMNAQPTRER